MSNWLLFKRNIDRYDLWDVSSAWSNCQMWVHTQTVDSFLSVLQQNRHERTVVKFWNKSLECSFCSWVNYSGSMLSSALNRSCTFPQCVGKLCGGGPRYLRVCSWRKDLRSIASSASITVKKIRICRPEGPSRNQLVGFSGHKRINCLAYQTVNTFDGLVFSLKAQLKGVDMIF